MKKIVLSMLYSSMMLATTLNFYSGSTMAQTMQEVANKFENKTGVHVKII